MAMEIAVTAEDVTPIIDKVTEQIASYQPEWQANQEFIPTIMLPMRQWHIILAVLKEVKEREQLAINQ